MVNPFFLSMDKLEFELFEPSGSHSLHQRNESIEIECVKADSDVSEQEEQALAIQFSKNIMAFLEKEMKKHNKGLPKDRNTTLAQLKTVYRNGARIFAEIYKKSFPEKNPNLWALARISMFLRMKKGEAVESSNKDIKIKQDIDLSESWLPLEEDFTKAKQDIEDNDLTYKYENVDNELYLDEYERIEVEW